MQNQNNFKKNGGDPKGQYKEDFLGKAQKVTDTLLGYCRAKLTGELTQPPKSQLEENGPDELKGKEVEEVSSIFMSVLTSSGTWKNTVGCCVGCAE